MSPDEMNRNQNAYSSGTAAASGAATPPREDALAASGRGGQTAGRQHSQNVNRGTSGRTDGPPGLGE
jgi:hypothetical protein